MGAVGQADGGRGARDFLHGDDMFEITEAEPAIVFLHGDAVQAELTHFGPDPARGLVTPVERLGDRREPVPGKARTGLADHVGGLAMGKIEHHGAGVSSQ